MAVFEEEEEDSHEELTTIGCRVEPQEIFDGKDYNTGGIQDEELLLVGIATADRTVVDVPGEDRGTGGRGYQQGMVSMMLHMTLTAMKKPVT